MGHIIYNLKYNKVPNLGEVSVLPAGTHSSTFHQLQGESEAGALLASWEQYYNLHVPGGLCNCDKYKRSTNGTVV